MAFTRESVLLKWSGGGTERSFRVLREGYSGGATVKPASYARSLSDGGMLRVHGTRYRSFQAVLLVLDSPSGSIDSVTEGDIDELEAAFQATDLQCKSLEDSAYWDAEWVGTWNAQVEYDPDIGETVVRRRRKPGRVEEEWEDLDY